MTHILLKHRFETAGDSLLGDRNIWLQKIEESDDFALQTAEAGKGGPFGAQL